jgi:hypothetical protein
VACLDSNAPATCQHERLVSSRAICCRCSECILASHRNLCRRIASVKRVLQPPLETTVSQALNYSLMQAIIARSILAILLWGLDITGIHLYTAS